MLKIKLALISVIMGFFVMTTAFTNANIQDNSQLLDRKTSKLIRAKNDRYFQTSEQPRIVVRTQKGIEHLTPKHLNKSHRTVFIVVGSQKKKRNVQIYSSKDLHSAFSADVRGNILRSQSEKLRSNNQKEFNVGLRFVFKACATTIDQEYQYALDQYDLTNDERAQITHPHRMALPIALALVLVISGLALFLKKHSHVENK
ncbi:TPM domain-containing protein [Lactobacillus sp. ESL0684]|uniref:TPM domain-containing protein n=1 Tax=Lactobacillus sp. ESL0684 TaxID=2983213 RepID=UPI0023FA359B|nr:TPM domain-containing protein [Lactobacillus sp. ESL0684]WEV44027.1 TPM domain-containing protein [Lactobacillus sp. ESL0684]